MAFISNLCWISADLDEEQKAALVDAMFEKPVAAGEIIIRCFRF